MSNFITFGTGGLNLDHVISAEFLPELPVGFVDDNGHTFIGGRVAMLKLTTTERTHGLDVIERVIPANVTETLIGEKAAAAWEYIQAQSTDVLEWVENRRQRDLDNEVIRQAHQAGKRKRA